MKKGDTVLLTVGERTVRAVVSMMSGNGRSLLLLFDAALDLRQGTAVGMLPAFLGDDGQWIEIVSHTPLKIQEDK